jgi:cytochrome c55X
MPSARALILCAAGLFAAASSDAAVAEEPSPARRETLIYRLRQDCGSCHGLTMKGGLGPPLLPATLAGKPEKYLIEVILHGIPDTAMPPWAFEIERSEAAWLVRQLRKGLRP